MKRLLCRLFGHSTKVYLKVGNHIYCGGDCYFTRGEKVEAVCSRCLVSLIDIVIGEDISTS